MLQRQFYKLVLNLGIQHLPQIANCPDLYPNAQNTARWRTIITNGKAKNVDDVAFDQKGSLIMTSCLKESLQSSNFRKGVQKHNMTCTYAHYSGF